MTTDTDLKEGDVVETPHGVGTIIELEVLERITRAGVKMSTWHTDQLSQTLQENFGDRLHYYFMRDLQKIE